MNRARNTNTWHLRDHGLFIGKGVIGQTLRAYSMKTRSTTSSTLTCMPRSDGAGPAFHYDGGVFEHLNLSSWAKWPLSPRECMDRWAVCPLPIWLTDPSLHRICGEFTVGT